MQTVRMIGLVGLCVLTATALQAAGEAAGTCPWEPLGAFAAGAAVDGRTFRLDDGREVRLAAIEAPPGDAARMALEKLLAGHTVALKKIGSASDRYGRIVAQAFINQEGGERWVQQEMVAAGQARAAASLGPPACAEPLLASERAARQAKLGLWADPYYAIKVADDAAGLLGARGRFTIAEGKVLSVRESGATIYVNFGRVWSRNLTVTILKRNERAFIAAGVELKKLAGRRVRVRGWIEDRNGPQIEATRPEQIELAERD